MYFSLNLYSLSLEEPKILTNMRYLTHIHFYKSIKFARYHHYGNHWATTLEGATARTKAGIKLRPDLNMNDYESLKLIIVGPFTLHREPFTLHYILAFKHELIGENVYP